MKLSEDTNLENAIADMKIKLRAQSKSYLVRSWLRLYVENMGLKLQMERLTKAESSDSVANGTETPKGEQDV